MNVKNIVSLPEINEGDTVKLKVALYGGEVVVVNRKSGIVHFKAGNSDLANECQAPFSDLDKLERMPDGRVRVVPVTVLSKHCTTPPLTEVQICEKLVACGLADIDQEITDVTGNRAFCWTEEARYAGGLALFVPAPIVYAAYMVQAEANGRVEYCRACGRPHRAATPPIPIDSQLTEDELAAHIFCRMSGE